MEETHLGVGEHEQNFVFDVLELLLHSCIAENELGLHVGKVRPLRGDRGAQQLLFQPLWRH